MWIGWLDGDESELDCTSYEADKKWESTYLRSRFSAVRETVEDVKVFITPFKGWNFVKNYGRGTVDLTKAHWTHVAGGGLEREVSLDENKCA